MALIMLSSPNISLVDKLELYSRRRDRVLENCSRYRTDQAPRSNHHQAIHSTPDSPFYAFKMTITTGAPDGHPLMRTMISSQPSQSISSFSFAPRQRLIMAPKNAQCTHLTMTRLYTTEFRCGICLRLASMGWVYRCTQDREILIEEDVERGEAVRRN